MGSNDQERLAFFASLRIPGASYWTLCFETPSFDRRFASPGERISWLASREEARRLLDGLDSGLRIEEDVIEAAFTCDLVGLQAAVASGQQTQSHGDLLDTIDLLDDMLLTALDYGRGQPPTPKICETCRSVMDELARGLFGGDDWVDIIERAGGHHVIESAMHDALGVVLAASSFVSPPPVRDWDALLSLARSGEEEAVQRLGRVAMAS